MELEAAILVNTISVLRLGHRKERDKRISTHCGLVARAFGADEIIYSGEKDDKMLEGITKVKTAWGGKFAVKYNSNWRKAIKAFKGTKIHLTMYGEPFKKHLNKIKKIKKILIIIGSQKVPPEVYQLVDFNLSITNQPHSEVGALAVFLHELVGNKKAEKKFANWQRKIVGMKKGKNILVRKARQVVVVD